MWIHWYLRVNLPSHENSLCLHKLRWRTTLQVWHLFLFIIVSVTRKKLGNVYKSCSKMISLGKWKTLSALQKLIKTLGNLDKIIVPQALKSCPKYNKSPNLVALNIVFIRSFILYLFISSKCTVKCKEYILLPLCQVCEISSNKLLLY